MEMDGPMRSTRLISVKVVLSSLSIRWNNWFHTKIARYQDLNIIVSDKCHKNVGKAKSDLLCFKALKKGTKTVLFDGHA